MWFFSCGDSASSSDRPSAAAQRSPGLNCAQKTFHVVLRACSSHVQEELATWKRLLQNLEKVTSPAKVDGELGPVQCKQRRYHAAYRRALTHFWIFAAFIYKIAERSAATGTLSLALVKADWSVLSPLLSGIALSTRSTAFCGERKFFHLQKIVKW